MLQHDLNSVIKSIETNKVTQSIVFQGELPPDEALKAITISEGKFSRLKEERDNVAKAKEALELAEPGTGILQG